MVAPVLFIVNAFDSAFEHTFNFSNDGNPQAVKNRMRVYKSEDRSLVYDETVESMKLYHSIPANRLTNGICYNAEIQIIDSTGAESPFSNQIVFYCYTTPSWNFTNLVQNQIITNSSFQAQVSYSQLEGEKLNSYQFILYDGLSNEIFSTPKRYDTTNLSYSISNLSDDKAYFLRATGETLNGMVLDTGLIGFTVSYIQPAMFALVHLDNVYDEGYIKITSNIITIEGKATPDPPKYIDDKKIDLTEDGSSVIFDEGFTIQNDFTLKSYLENLTQNTTVIELSNGKNRITIDYRFGSFDGEEEKSYFELRSYAGEENYYLMSNTINKPNSTDRIFLFIRRINNVYEIKCENMGVVT